LPVFHDLILEQKDKIDTTGNWVWEAEEIMAYYLLKNGEKYLYNDSVKNLFKVLELGAGTSGFASISFKINYQALLEIQNIKIKLHITDGKKENCFYL
jgi:hypothetical protein